jgi:hypothetical protein
VGFLRKLIGHRDAPATIAETPSPPVGSLQVRLLGGTQTLNVVGESNYQQNIWQSVGGFQRDRIRHDVVAVLTAEPENPFDSNAVSAWISGLHVGYLAREDAVLYQPGLQQLVATHGVPIALSGVVAGGGSQDGRERMVGVFLNHDPADFGLQDIVRPARPPSRPRELRTGLSHAIATDAQDDSYDLSWLEELSPNANDALGQLRQLLVGERDPIDRHFMFAEIEWRLYRARDAFASALEEYDDTCRQHDAEMESIRAALVAKFGSVPLLETYKQVVIRHQKAKNLSEAIRWAERGLTVYGDDCSRPEAIEDLKQRVDALTAKIERSMPRPRKMTTSDPPES